MDQNNNVPHGPEDDSSTTSSSTPTPQDVVVQRNAPHTVDRLMEWFKRMTKAGSYFLFARVLPTFAVAGVMTVLIVHYYIKPGSMDPTQLEAPEVTVSERAVKSTVAVHIPDWWKVDSVRVYFHPVDRSIIIHHQTLQDHLRDQSLGPIQTTETETIRDLD